MTRRLLVLALVVLTLCGCAAGQSGASSSASPSSRTRCLVNPNEGATRPLVFLFCVESP